MEAHRVGHIRHDIQRHTMPTIVQLPAVHVYSGLLTLLPLPHVGEGWGEGRQRPRNSQTKLSAQGL